MSPHSTRAFAVRLAEDDAFRTLVAENAEAALTEYGLAGPGLVPDEVVLPDKEALVAVGFEAKPPTPPTPKPPKPPKPRSTPSSSTRRRLASVRRTRHLVLRCEEEPGADIAALLRGEVRTTPARPDVAVSALTGAEVALEPGDLELLLSVPTDSWVVDTAVGDPAVVRRLAERGLLVSDEPDGLLAELRARDERLNAVPWHHHAALHRATTAWDRVEVAVSEEAPAEELAETFARGSPAFIERYGPPPPHFHHVGEAVALPPVDRDGPLYELLRGRRTARGFDTGRPLSAVELSTVLRWVWGCHGTAALGELVVLKKTSPSGGSLHPIEAYLLVRAVEGVEPGLYHYNVEHHGLTKVEPLEDGEAAELASLFLGGQWYFASAPVLFVLAARFDRSFWKYRDHDKAYSAILLDAGHLSQTFYLVCAELGLDAFVAGAINDATIDDRLGLPRFEQGAIAICGCGRAAPSGLEPVFEPR